MGNVEYEKKNSIKDSPYELLNETILFVWDTFFRIVIKV